MNKEYYIRTTGYSGNLIIWWRPNERGYTSDLNQAGRYSKEAAAKICKHSGTELAYECAIIDAMEEGIIKGVHADFLQRSEANIGFSKLTSTKTTADSTKQLR